MHYQPPSFAAQAVASNTGPQGARRAMGRKSYFGILTRGGHKLKMNIPEGMGKLIAMLVSLLPLALSDSLGKGGWLGRLFGDSVISLHGQAPKG